jgi:hypothetical protein
LEIKYKPLEGKSKHKMDVVLISPVSLLRAPSLMVPQNRTGVALLNVIDLLRHFRRLQKWV